MKRTLRVGLIVTLSSDNDVVLSHEAAKALHALADDPRFKAGSYRTGERFEPLKDVEIVALFRNDYEGEIPQ